MACKLIFYYYAPIIPASAKDLINAILSELHSTSLGGHLGYKKMLAMCRGRFYWPKMRVDVDRFCRHCAIC